MDINFKCGYYIQNKLLEISADLNVDVNYYSELKRILKIKKVKNKELIRVGLPSGDGGYVMLRDFEESVNKETLNQFDQIVFELHNIVKAGNGEKILKLLNKINETHAVIHVHGNNSGWLLTINGTVFPDVLEVSNVNKNKYKTFDDENY